MLKTFNSSLTCSNETSKNDCWIPGDCADVSIPLNFTIGMKGSNATFSIPMENLMQYHARSDECVIEIATLGDIEEYEIRIGEPFFRSFYSVFDNTNKRIGLALSAISPLGSTILNPPKPPEPEGPTYEPTTVWNLWTQLLIVLLLILIALIFSLLCYMRHLKKINESERNANGAVAENRS